MPDFIQSESPVGSGMGRFRAWGPVPAVRAECQLSVLSGGLGRDERQRGRCAESGRSALSLTSPRNVEVEPTTDVTITCVEPRWAVVGLAMAVTSCGSPCLSALPGRSDGGQL